MRLITGSGAIPSTTPEQAVIQAPAYIAAARLDASNSAAAIVATGNTQSAAALNVPVAAQAAIIQASNDQAAALVAAASQRSRDAIAAIVTSNAANATVVADNLLISNRAAALAAVTANPSTSLAYIAAGDDISGTAVNDPLGVFLQISMTGAIVPYYLYNGTSAMSMSGSTVLFVYAGEVYLQQFGEIDPTKKVGLTGVVKVITDGSTHVALKSDGTLWGWGLNTCLTNGGLPATVVTPIQLYGWTGLVDMSLGGGTIAAVTSSGTVVSAGANAGGTTAAATNGYYTSSLTGVKQVACCLNSVCALKTDGTVWWWSPNGMIPNAQSVYIPTVVQTPLKINVVTTFTQIQAIQNGTYFNAISSNGTMYGWGGLYVTNGVRPFVPAPLVSWGYTTNPIVAMSVGHSSSTDPANRVGVTIVQDSAGTQFLLTNIITSSVSQPLGKLSYAGALNIGTSVSYTDAVLASQLQIDSNHAAQVAPAAAAAAVYSAVTDMNTAIGNGAVIVAAATVSAQAQYDALYPAALASSTSILAQAAANAATVTAACETRVASGFYDIPTRDISSWGMGAAIISSNDPSAIGDISRINEVVFDSWHYQYIATVQVIDTVVTLPAIAATNNISSYTSLWDQIFGGGPTYIATPVMVSGVNSQAVCNHMMTYIPFALGFDMTNGKALSSGYVQAYGDSMRVINISVDGAQIFVSEQYSTYTTSLPAMTFNLRVLILAQGVLTDPLNNDPRGWYADANRVILGCGKLDSLNNYIYQDEVNGCRFPTSPQVEISRAQLNASGGNSLTLLAYTDGVASSVLPAGRATSPLAGAGTSIGIATL
jgi:hypothetical protein